MNHQEIVACESSLLYIHTHTFYLFLFFTSFVCVYKSSESACVSAITEFVALLCVWRKEEQDWMQQLRPLTRSFLYIRIIHRYGCCSSSIPEFDSCRSSLLSYNVPINSLITNSVCVCVCVHLTASCAQLL